MKAGSFQDAKQIYNSALEREPAQWATYLKEACGGNESLRKEVETLLICRTEAQKFFETPPTFAEESSAEFAGRTLSHYDIIEKIGQGGMGVVYRARDTHLDRFVALKVLPSDRIADPERKRRFVQEAQAASALNHPNIVTIHDIEAAEGVTFIVMEFIRGSTLERLIRDGSLGLSETLKAGSEIADALAAAHAAGIIHRDVKPANIMVNDKGLVKVLDFGLAKLTEPLEPGELAAMPTAETETQEGVIAGTVAYMSPEQAQGKKVDARSDIFSLGSLLYEMSTGRRAFSGDTRASTLAAILEQEPKPASEVAIETPRELEQVIHHCLRKDPEQRLQRASDVASALQELRRAHFDGQAPADLSPVRRNRRLLALSGSFLLATAIGLAVWFVRQPASRPTPSVGLLTTLGGMQSNPAFSPDGTQMAIIWNKTEKSRCAVYLQHLGDTTVRKLTSHPGPEYGPVWSPDASRIAFVRSTSLGAEVITVPAAGGTERRLAVSRAFCEGAAPPLAKQFCGVSWSPNGKFLTFVDREAPQASNSIFLLDFETHRRRKLTNPPPSRQDGLSVFSPDGKTLAFARGPFPLCDIYVLPLSETGQPNGEARPLTRENMMIIGFDWTADGRSIIFSSLRGGTFGLWRAALSGSDPERLSVGGNGAYFPTVAKQGDRLAYSEGDPDFNIWRVAAPGAAGGNTGSAAPLRISPSPLLDQGPDYSPDGRQVAWASAHTGLYQIWVSNSDGSHLKQLTHLPAPGASEVRWSPDSRQIAFLGYSSGPTQIYVMEAKGGAPRRLTSGNLIDGPTFVPTWSSDGRWIYFVANREGLAVWKVPAAGGSPVLVVAQALLPVESPDGKFLYFLTTGSEIRKIPTSGGSPVPVAQNAGWFRLSRDGHLVYYYGPDQTIWKSPADGGEATPLRRIGERARWTISASGIFVLDPDARSGPALEFTPFGSKRTAVLRLPDEPDNYAEGIGEILASPDGRWVVYPRRDRYEGRIMLVENFR